MTRTRPTPAVLVAVLALVVALAGATTAGFAAGKASGNSLIKKHSLSGNRLKPDSITGQQVQESTLGKVAQAGSADNALATPPGAFVPLTTNPGWSATPGRQAVGFRKDAAGFIHLQGAVSYDSGGDNTALTLPPSARPGTLVVLNATNITEEDCALFVRTDGTVDVITNPLTFAIVSLDGLVYLPGQ